MNYENVKLWFAKDQSENIITINEVEENNTYACPVCGSELRPKAINSKRVTPHFAHVDSSKCSGESMIHFWFKHKFIEVGDTFTILTDKEITYKCKEIHIEKIYNVDGNIYKPDVTIITECGETVFFEMNYSNKKEVKDYIDIWLALKKTVVEINIKSLVNIENKFKALFYNGKCFNTKRNDSYYNTIGKHKEEMSHFKSNDELKNRIKKLDWFWEDMIRYKKGEISIDRLTDTVKHIEIEEKFVVYDIVKKIRCSEVAELRNYLKETIKNYRTMHRFYSSIESDSPIKRAVNELNCFFKNIDMGYKVVLDSNTVKRKSYRYTRRRKIGYWSVEYYYYRLNLRHRLDEGFNLHSFDITTYIKEINDSDLIFDYFIKKIKKHSINVKCIHCEEKFNLTSDEVVFYKNNNLRLPKRCKSCRSKRKDSKLKKGGLFIEK
ncbi:competence protein CoiA family protein [Priestia megaterium]|uniref:competence protein CoiA family protein n=1 Tax=Priestia megaterium TaxID=1404 RepID=UPI001128255D|nr:zinc-ribbon domain containing protein [Priestia megaterium]TPF17953.1 hypothetical protein CBE78_01645 [Priestia megaterium]TPF22061.1 hypothetical protein CBE79_04150 [Priestia megaterium]